MADGTRRRDLTFALASPHEAARLLAFESCLSDQDRAVYAPHSTHLDAVNDITSNQFFFIEGAGIDIATISYRREPDLTVYIGNACVHPQRRGTGVGRLAMREMMKMNPDALAFTLLTHQNNVTAQALYRSLGFVVTGVERPPFAPDADFVRMRLAQRRR
jgi:ribosomal protein S18 acetylase RimI-like enzyme